MICKNCGKEIIENQQCNYCGYKPEDDQKKIINYNDVNLPETEVKKLKTKNGAANTAFVMSFFSIIFPFGGISFILSIVGFFKAKKARCGRVKSIFAFIFSIMPIVLAILAILVDFIIIFFVLGDGASSSTFASYMIR